MHARPKKPRGEQAEEQKTFRLGRVQVSLTAMAAGVENDRQHTPSRSQVAPRKVENAGGNDQQPQDIDNPNGPHHWPEDLYDWRVNIKNSRGFVIPEVTVKQLSAQQALRDHAISGLVAAKGVANIGQRPQKDQA